MEMKTDAKTEMSGNRCVHTVAHSCFAHLLRGKSFFYSSSSWGPARFDLFLNITRKVKINRDAES